MKNEAKPYVLLCYYCSVDFFLFQTWEIVCFSVSSLSVKEKVTNQNHTQAVPQTNINNSRQSNQICSNGINCLYYKQYFTIEAGMFHIIDFRQWEGSKRILFNSQFFVKFPTIRAVLERSICES